MLRVVLGYASSRLVLAGFVMLSRGDAICDACLRRAALRIPYEQHWRRLRFQWDIQIRRDWRIAERAMTVDEVHQVRRAERIAGIGAWLVVGGLLGFLVRALLPV